jgi:hypothetical protein
MLTFPIRREIAIASIALSLALASTLSSASPTPAPGQALQLHTRILLVEAPASAGAPYTVLSTADGAVYTVSPRNQSVLLTLQALSSSDAARVPVRLSLRGREIVAVVPLSAGERAGYTDAVMGMSTEEILAQINAAGVPNPVVPPAPVAPAPQPETEEEEEPEAEIELETPSHELDPELEPAPQPGPVTAPAPTDPYADEPEAPAVPTPRPAEILPYPIVEFKKKQGYNTTILDSVEKAQQYFTEMRNLRHKAQCHERAMVWAHDLYENHKVNSMKVMMFYTMKFRTEFQHESKWGNRKIYEWWYHTAPLVYVRTDQGIKPYVLDREFLDRAVTLDDWSYHFMVTEIAGNEHDIPYSNVSSRKLTREQAKCRLIGHFKDYAVPNLLNYTGEKAPWCQVRIFPMYYMQPGNVAMMDCVPGQHPDYIRGLVGYGFWDGPVGSKVLTKKKRDGSYKWGCQRVIQTDFDKDDLKTAYKKAPERAPDPKTGR